MSRDLVPSVTFVVEGKLTGRFAAPLTPTIRRYLDIPAANGAVIKTKPARAQAVAPVNHSAPHPHIARTTTSEAAASARPQHHRVTALTARPARAPAAHHQPSAPLPGPSRRQASPVEAVLEEEEEPPKPALTKSVSSQATRPEVPFARHGRSVSHNILPSASSTSSLASEPIPEYHNPLSRPVRLQQSSSTASLPTALDFEPSRPARPAPSRFATGPVRIVRPLPVPTFDEHGVQVASEDVITIDGFLCTPSGATVLRGPVRPTPNHQPVGLGRKPMRQATRRVVTAPGAIPEAESTGSASAVLSKTPGPSRVIDGNVKQKAELFDGRSGQPQTVSSVNVFTTSPTKPIDHTLPSTEQPQCQESNTPVLARPASSSTAPRPTIDSPLMPVLAPAHIEQGDEFPFIPVQQLTEELKNTELDDMEASDSAERSRIGMGSPTPLHVAAKVALPDDEEGEVDHADEVIEVVTKGQGVRGVEVEQMEVGEPGTRLAETQALGATEEDVGSADRLPAVSVSTNVGQDGVVDQQPSPLTKPTISATGREDAVTAAPVEEALQTAPLTSHKETATVAVTTTIVSTDQTSAPLPHNPRAPTDQAARHKPAQPTSRLASKASDAPVKKPAVATAAKATFSSITTSASAPVSRKPPVPRVVHIAAERKPFRPVRAAVAAAAAAKAEGPKAIKAATGANDKGKGKDKEPSTKSLPTGASSDAVVATSGPGRAAPQSKATVVASKTDPPPPRARQPLPDGAKVSTLTQPTKASSQRAAPPPHTTSSSTTAITTGGSAQSRPRLAPTQPTLAALPPVKKEKIVRKAPLPSFRPVRHTATAGAGASADRKTNSLQSSTASTLTSSRALNPVEKKVVAKVKPEQIPLPASPASKPSTTATDRPIDPEAVALPPSPMVNSGTPTRSPSIRMSTGRIRVRPENIALPLSPARSISQSNSSPSQKLVGSSVSPRSTGNGPSPGIAQATSVVRPDTALSTCANEEDEGHAMSGVTFKMPYSRSLSSSSPLPNEQRTMSLQIMKHSMGVEHNTPSKNMAFDLLNTTTTPRYTPARRALVDRDANVGLSVGAGTRTDGGEGKVGEAGQVVKAMVV